MSCPRQGWGRAPLCSSRLVCAMRGLVAVELRFVGSEKSARSRLESTMLIGAELRGITTRVVADSNLTLPSKVLPSRVSILPASAEEAPKHSIDAARHHPP